MLFRIILFILGFFLMILGNFYIIIYINLFSFGYNIFEYFEYIFTSYECYYLLVGIILIIISIYKKGWFNVIYLWYFA